MTVITKEVVDWLAQFDVPVSRKDSKADAMWKAGQRDIHLRAKAIYEQQSGKSGKASAKAKGFNLRPKDCDN